MDILELLNQYSDALMVIVTAIYALVTIRICGANMKTVEEARKQLDEQKRQASETEKYYEETLSQQKKDARISKMPYFYMMDDVCFGERAGGIFFSINLENCGNGSAVNVCIETKEDLSYYGFPIIFENEHFKIIYRYVAPLSKNFAKIGEVINFEVFCDAKGPQGLLPADSVNFAVLFEDMLGNRYRQTFFIQYKTDLDDYANSELGFHGSYPPILRESELP